MSWEIPFEPCPLLKGPHQQTIVGAFWNSLEEPPSDQLLFRLPDGDQISMEVSTPLTWKPEHPTVLLVHGVCGSHRSPVVARMATRLYERGIRAVRFNMRGCGSGRGLAREMYHSGRSDDLFEGIKVLKKRAPASPLLLIGFSLGGNISLKLAGELHRLAPSFLSGVVAVSPPVDLYSSIHRIGDPSNGVYERYFYSLLRDEVLFRHRTFKELPPLTLPKRLKIYEFDQVYTAPIYGFKNAFDYYNKCSAIHFLSDIELPCRILLTDDDPIVSSTALDEHSLAPHIELFKTGKGGHLGYLGDPRHERGFYWIDSLLMEWVRDFFS